MSIPTPDHDNVTLGAAHGVEVRPACPASEPEGPGDEPSAPRNTFRADDGGATRCERSCVERQGGPRQACPLPRCRPCLARPDCLSRLTCGVPLVDDLHTDGGPDDESAFGGRRPYRVRTCGRPPRSRLRRPRLECTARPTPTALLLHQRRLEPLLPLVAVPVAGSLGQVQPFTASRCTDPLPARSLHPVKPCH